MFKNRKRLQTIMTVVMMLVVASMVVALIAPAFLQ